MLPSPSGRGAGGEGLRHGVAQASEPERQPARVWHRRRMRLHASPASLRNPRWRSGSDACGKKGALTPPLPEGEEVGYLLPLASARRRRHYRNQRLWVQQHSPRRSVPNGAIFSVGQTRPRTPRAFHSKAQAKSASTGCDTQPPRTLKAIPSKAQGGRPKGANPGLTETPADGNSERARQDASCYRKLRPWAERPGGTLSEFLGKRGLNPGLAPFGRQPWALLGNAFSVRGPSARKRAAPS